MLRSQLEKRLGHDDFVKYKEMESGTVEAVLLYAREIARKIDERKDGCTLNEIMIVALAEALQSTIEARGADLTELERRIENERAARLEAEAKVRELMACGAERSALIFAYMKHVIDAEGVSLLGHERASRNLTAEQLAILESWERLIESEFTGPISNE